MFIERLNESHRCLLKLARTSILVSLDTLHVSLVLSKLDPNFSPGDLLKGILVQGLPPLI